MTTSTIPVTDDRRSMHPDDARPRRAIAALLAVEALLAFAPVVLMGGIGWPASLGLAPGEQLANIAAHPDTVRTGYAAYLAYSVLVLPATAAIAAVALRARPALQATAIAFAALSALARSIGILRWLTAMPALAAAYAAQPEQRAAIELVFTAVHAWGGAIGERLGVGLFMAGALACIALGGWSTRGLPRVLAVACGVVAALAAGVALPLAGGPAPPMAPVFVALSAWQLAVAAWLAWPRRDRARPSQAVR